MLTAEKLVERLHQKGFCDGEGVARSKTNWVCLEVKHIIELFNSTNWGLLNYLLAQAGLLEGAAPATDPAEPAPDTEAAVRADPRLSDTQKEALLAVYRSYVAGNLRNT